MCYNDNKNNDFTYFAAYNGYAIIRLAAILLHGLIWIWKWFHVKYYAQSLKRVITISFLFCVWTQVFFNTPTTSVSILARVFRYRKSYTTRVFDVLLFFNFL